MVNFRLAGQQSQIKTEAMKIRNSNSSSGTLSNRMRRMYSHKLNNCSHSISSSSSCQRRRRGHRHSRRRLLFINQFIIVSLYYLVLVDNILDSAMRHNFTSSEEVGQRHIVQCERIDSYVTSSPSSLIHLLCSTSHQLPVPTLHRSQSTLINKFIDGLG